MTPERRWVGTLLPSPRVEAAALVSAAVVLTLATGPLIAMAGGLRGWIVIVVVAAVGLGTLGTSASACLALTVLPIMGLIRRMTAGPAAYIESDPLVPLAMLLLLPVALQPLRGLQNRATWWLVGLASWLGVCTLWSVAHGQTVTAGFAFLTAAAPVLVAAQASTGRLPGLHRYALRWLPPLATACALYGVYQYYSPPAWDLAWLTSVQEKLVSVGFPRQGQFRIFGPAESPGVYAAFLGAAATLTVLRPLGQGRRVARVLSRTFMVATITFALSLTAVRSVLLALPIGIGIALLMRGRRERVVAIPAIAVVATALSFLPTLFSTSNADTSRYDLGSISQDESFVARLELLARFGTALGNPIGEGLGTTGAAGVIVDNGYLARTMETGLVGLAVFIGAVAVALRPAIQRARAQRARPGDSAWLAVVAFFLVYDFSGPLISGGTGLLFWLAVSALAAPDPPSPTDRITPLGRPEPRRDHSPAAPVRHSGG
jgi:putative inorganic carbon (HCO3(-)) transporter